MAGPLVPLAVAFGALSVGSSVYGGMQGRRAARRRAQALSRMAQEERQLRKYDEATERRAAQRGLAAQKVAYVKAGVEFGQGSALSVALNTVMEYENEIQKRNRASELRARSIEEGVATETLSGRTSMLAGVFGGLETIGDTLIGLAALKEKTA